MQPEIEKFQKLLRRLKWFGQLNRSKSRLLNALNPFNYVSMGAILNLGRFSGDFRYKILKPMFINFLMATNVFDMPASLFCRYLEFFDIETATPMQTWDLGTRRIYEEMSAGFQNKIYLNRPVRKVYRRPTGVVVEDENRNTETFDDVVFACNANQTLMILDKPTFLESCLLSSIRYESELHNHTVVHSDASILPDNAVKPLATRSNHIEQYGVRPDNYEITYIMQQPAALGETIRQAMPCDLQSDQSYRRRKDRKEMVVSAHRTRRASYSFSDSLVSLRSGQEANVALRRTHSDQQSGDVFRIRPCYGETDRGRLSVSGFRSE